MSTSANPWAVAAGVDDEVVFTRRAARAKSEPASAGLQAAPQEAERGEPARAAAVDHALPRHSAYLAMLVIFDLTARPPPQWLGSVMSFALRYVSEAEYKPYVALTHFLACFSPFEMPHILMLSFLNYTIYTKNPIARVGGYALYAIILWIHSRLVCFVANWFYEAFMRV
jgi:hypothetical protein